MSVYFRDLICSSHLTLKPEIPINGNMGEMGLICRNGHSTILPPVVVKNANKSALFHVRKATTIGSSEHVSKPNVELSNHILFMTLIDFYSNQYNFIENKMGNDFGFYFVFFP